MFTNADQFLNKRDDLLQYISSSAPSIILIVEVIPKAQVLPISIAHFALPGYTPYHNFNPDDSHLGASGIRGVCIFAHNSLQVSEVSFSTPFSEQVWLRVELARNDALLIGNLYRSPSSTENNNNDLCKLLEEVSRAQYSHLLIVGDFNYGDIDWARGLSKGSTTQYSPIPQVSGANQGLLSDAACSSPYPVSAWPDPPCAGPHIYQ